MFLSLVHSYIYLCNFIDFFLAVLGLLCFMGFSLVATSGGYSLLPDVAFSLRWLLLLQSTGPGTCRLWWLQLVDSVVVAPRLRSMGSTVAAHGLSCSVASGIFPDQGSNPGLLRWQVDSLPLSHQGSPYVFFDKRKKKNLILASCKILDFAKSWILSTQRFYDL